MSKQTLLRVGVILTSVVITAVIAWQFLPGAFAQRSKRDLTETESTQNKVSPNTDDDSLILLNAGPIDARSAESQAARKAVNGFDGKRMHLVRFAGSIKPAWYKMLTDSGLEIIDYIPNYTYLVYGDSNALTRIQEASKNANNHIEWDGEYKDSYRYSPSLYKQSRKGGPPMLSSDQFEVQLYKDEAVNTETLSLIGSMLTTPVKGQQEIMHYVNLVVGLDEQGLAKLASRPDVISINPYFEPKKLDERQDIILTGNMNISNEPNPADYLAYLAAKGFTQAQFDASNFAVDLTDSGVDNANPANPFHFLLRRSGDPALASRFIYSRLEGTPHSGSTLQGCDGHGNLNASIIGGYVPGGGIFSTFPHADASAFRYGLGVAPFVKVGSSVIFDPSTFTSPNLPNLQSKAYNDGARISSNSWGSSSNAYTTTSQAYDALVRDAQPTGATFPVAGNQQMVIVFAAGNDGSGGNTVGSPGTGKNVITVGASENVQAFGGADQCGTDDDEADSALDIVAFSSRGPSSDQRKKPDIMLPGTHVSGSVAQASNVSPVSGTGAQLACFTALGVCAGPGGSNFFPAAQQWYTASSGTSHSTPAISGASALMRQDFINRGIAPPSPALTKALLMNTAKYMDGVGANDSLPSNNQGMGLANLNNYFDIFAQGRILRDQNAADTFTASGQQRIFAGNVPSSSKPFRVTLAWTDTPGSTTGNAFVNNLDLEVTVGGNTYKGNVFTGANSSTGGSADIRNNVESVFLPAGVTGTFVVKVKATNIAGDGVPGDANLLDQDFALVVWNGNESPVSVMERGATTFAAESCQINNAIDPNETVTINFALSNVGTANTANLTATLLATGGVTAPSGPQNYGVVTSGGAAVSRPFTFTGNTTCGTVLTATLHLQDGATDLGNVTFKFNTGAESAANTAKTFSTGNIATAVPDSGSVDIPFVVTDTGVVTDMNVKFRMNHTFDGDITATLISPAGTAVPLVLNRGGSGDNFGTGANDCTGVQTVFDDSAATAITAGTAPFANSFRPETPLSALNGELLTGTWIMRFADTADLDTGTVGCVQLETTRHRFVCCGVAGTPEIVSTGNAVITAEGFTPLNNAPDPGETVTVNVSLGNSGDGNTGNLVATLQNSGGVTPVTTSQNYGVVIAAGAPVVRPFTFVANGVCGGSITLTIHLQDGALDLGNVQYTFQLGTTQFSSQTFTNPATITIPTTPANQPGNPYPSNITVVGAPTTITSVKVTLTNMDHTFPTDLDILVVSPTGRKFIVMSDAGGITPVTGRNYTFDDAAAATFPSGTPAGSGSFKPANYDTVQDPFLAPAPVGPYLTPTPGGTDTLNSAFAGVAGGNPNGVWSLYLIDDANQDGGSIAGGWSLELGVSSPVCSSTPGVTIRSRADFDGDQRTDLSVFRPSDGNWFVYNAAGTSIVQWGTSTDIITPGDFDNDNKTDRAVFRQSTGQWFVLRSSDNVVNVANFGTLNDKPVVGDYDGDNKADVAVYRPSTGQWFILRSSNAAVDVATWGAPGTDIPVPGKYDGDSKSDLAVYRPSTGQWFIFRSSDSTAVSGTWGGAVGDKPVQADYDGDNKEDLAIYRPGEGKWYIFNSSNATISIVPWGAVTTDIPVPGDYDGDNKDDVAVYRPSTGQWFILGSTSGLQIGTWGSGADKAVPTAYIP